MDGQRADSTSTDNKSFIIILNYMRRIICEKNDLSSDFFFSLISFSQFLEIC